MNSPVGTVAMASTSCIVNLLAGTSILEVLSTQLQVYWEVLHGIIVTASQTSHTSHCRSCIGQPHLRCRRPEASRLHRGHRCCQHRALSPACGGCRPRTDGRADPRPVHYGAAAPAGSTPMALVSDTAVACGFPVFRHLRQ